MTLIVLKNTGQVFYTMSLNSKRSDVFLMIILVKNTTEVKCHFSPISVKHTDYNMTSLLMLTFVMSVRFLHRKVIFSPLHVVIFRKKYHEQLTSKESVNLHKICGIFLHRRFVYSPFVYLLNHLY